MPLKIIRNDITKMQVDAIVNTANPEPTYGSGVDMAVYLAAGEKHLLLARKEIGHMYEGEVAITSGFYLPARYIIHAVSPLYIDGESGEEEKLRSCYRKSLQLAKENNCKSIAFPLISTGSFGYPKEEGLGIAVDEIGSFLLWNDMLVYLVVFDEESTNLGRELSPALEAYIDKNYVEEKQEQEYRRPLFADRRKDRKVGFLRPKAAKDSAPMEDFDLCEKKASAAPSFCAGETAQAQPDYSDFLEDNQSALQERMRHLSDTFQEYLMYLIESRGLTNAEVYKRALITKQLFSKIKLNPKYHPDKATAMRL